MAPVTVLKRVMTPVKTMAARTERRRGMGEMSVRFDLIRSSIGSEVWKWSCKKGKRHDITRVGSWVDSEVFINIEGKKQDCGWEPS